MDRGYQVPGAARFAAVGSMVTLLFVEFGGRIRARLLAHGSFVFVIMALLSLAVVALVSVRWDGASS